MPTEPPAVETKECPFCAEVIKAKAIKCKHCGSMLTEEALERLVEDLGRLRAAAAAPEAPSADGTARLATVLFADLSGFTALSGTREPEEMREIMNALFSDLAGAVERFGGKVDKYIGDCVMAVWGTNEAHADDPARAANAALSMLQRVKGRAERLDLPLALHAGVATGRVVFGTVGTGAGAAKTVLGETVNLAARLCEAAPAGEVYASDETWRRIADRFAATEVGLDLKGIGRVRAHGIVPGRGRSRVTRRVVVDFQGCEAEVGRIASVLDGLREGTYGRRAGVLVVGQGGVGKSRLCAHAVARFGRGLRVLFAQAVPAETPAFGAIAAAWLHDLVGGGDVSAVDRFFGERPALAAYRSAARILVSSAEEAGQSSGFGSDRPLDRELARFLVEISKETPLVLAGADVQWADPLSIDLCLALAEGAAAGRIALVLDGRPGAAVDRLRAAPGVETIDLGLLSIDAMEAALRTVLVDPAPRDWVRAVHDRTGGVFIHFLQVLDALAEGGFLEEVDGTGRRRLVRPDRDLPIPESLQDLIWLRIERLASRPREVLLHAAVCGVRFPRRLLEEAIGCGADDLAPALRDLDADGFLHASGDALAFEHGSIRETARRMLLKSERRRIAERVLDAIGDRLPEDVVRPLAPDLFRDAGRETELRRFLASDAYRLVRAFRLDEARALLAAVGREAWASDVEGERARATYLTSLSRLAEASHDLAEAAARQDEAVAILRRTDPGSPELGRSLGLLGRLATKREAWDAAVAATTEAIETSRATGDERGLGIHVFMLGWIAEQREDWPTALRHFEDSLARQRSVRGLRVSHGSIGRAAIELGDLEKARRHGLEALRSAHQDDAISWNPHAYVSILSTTGRVAWKDGDAGTALAHLETGLALARATADDEALFMILLPLGRIAAEAGAPEVARDLADRALATARRLGFSRFERRVRRLIEEIRSIRPAPRPDAVERLRSIRASLDRPPLAREAIRPVGRADEGSEA